MESIYQKAYGETMEQYLWRLGNLKETGVISCTWDELAEAMNEAFCPDAPKNGSCWRKRFRRIQDKMMNDNVIDLAEARQKLEPAKPAPVQQLLEEPTEESEPAEGRMLNFFQEAEKQRLRLRDERTSYNRLMRQSARADAILDLFKEEISRYPGNPPKPLDIQWDNENQRAIYALLGDIHYGSVFSNRGGSFSPEIAEKRIMNYAEEIVKLGQANSIHTCYVSLLGDLISGNIHQTVRAENRENVVAQVIGVSELVADFLYVLAQHFSEVHVNSVSGNHSRLDLCAEDALRAEKLDALIPWYCKTKLESQSNVWFYKNTIDETIADFGIFGKNYIAVHGDFDKDLDKTALQVERNTGVDVDYVVAGHLHVPSVTMKNTGFIRNGSVCGSGDEFTMKKRLFGPPCQVAMIVGADGVESIYPMAI